MLKRLGEIGEQRGPAQRRLHRRLTRRIHLVAVQIRAHRRKHGRDHRHHTLALGIGAEPAGPELVDDATKAQVRFTDLTTARPYGIGHASSSAEVMPSMSRERRDSPSKARASHHFTAPGPAETE